MSRSVKFIGVLCVLFMASSAFALDECQIFVKQSVEAEKDARIHSWVAVPPDLSDAEDGSVVPYSIPVYDSTSDGQPVGPRQACYSVDLYGCNIIHIYR